MLPFALVDAMGYWAVPVVTLITFALYGIDGIGSQLEDPFGLNRNDIKMDFVVEDIRAEICALLDEWRRVDGGGGGGGDGAEMFVVRGRTNGAGAPVATAGGGAV